MEESQILIESDSPCCDIQAFVEQDENACYFYLWKQPNSKNPQMHACFVSNVKDAAHAVPVDVWLKEHTGRAPMADYQHVLHSKDGLTLQEEDLEIGWTQEGSGAGLYCKGELVAFIPEWANEGCPGFSKYLEGKSRLGWSLEPARGHLESILKKGKQFWEEIEKDYWEDFQESHLEALEDFMGEHKQYFAIDGGEFPPKALATGSKEGVLYGITLGVSALPQPMVEGFYQDKADDFSRIELGFACSQQREKDFMPVLERLAGASNIPWTYITSLGHGHTVQCKGVEGFVALWLLNANLIPNAPTPQYELAFGERVNLLWAVPLTQQEYDFLLEYDMEKIFQLDLPKEMIVFDGKPKLPKALLEQA